MFQIYLKFQFDTRCICPYQFPVPEMFPVKPLGSVKNDHSDHSCVWIVLPSFLNVFHIFFRICTPTLRPHPLSFSLNGHFSPWFTPGLRLLKKGIHSLLALLADASSLALEPERRGEAVEERWGAKTKRFNGIG